MPLVQLCAQNAIKTHYDTFSGKIQLLKGRHEVVLHTGDSSMLVDGSLKQLSRPVLLHRGYPVVAAGCVSSLLSAVSPEGEEGAGLRQGKHYFGSIRKVIIDAGHGGYDPGAIGKYGLKEKTVTLDIAKRLSALLRASGLEVSLTRSSDIFVPLEERVKKANSSGAELFVSVHINANHKRSLSGFEVYYVSPQVNDYKRAKAAAGEYALRGEDGEKLQASYEVKKILWDMVYCYSRAESVELARQICRKMDNEMDMKILGIKSARFHVLRGANMPAILIEAGFVSNVKEEKLLRDQRYRQKIAEKIAGGIECYAGEFLVSSSR